MPLMFSEMKRTALLICEGKSGDETATKSGMRCILAISARFSARRDYISKIYVKQQFRGHGIGKALLA
jgi:GNAT superfamily N-acetyltransferase